MHTTHAAAVQVDSEVDTTRSTWLNRGLSECHACWLAEVCPFLLGELGAKNGFLNNQFC